MKHLWYAGWLCGEFLLAQGCHIWQRRARKPLGHFLWLDVWFDNRIASSFVLAASTAVQTMAGWPGREQNGERCNAVC
ncbi:MAG: hypothetical protein DYG89_46100 [Caldilinea sp. CFX5]|nr:hypothetical protein [Caldilinea sp. CFX5]